MEKTPTYFHTPGVPEAIYNMNSSIRLILICREPVARAVSEYVQMTLSKPWFKWIAPQFKVSSDIWKSLGTSLLRFGFSFVRRLQSSFLALQVQGV